MKSFLLLPIIGVSLLLVLSSCQSPSIPPHHSPIPERESIPSLPSPSTAAPLKSDPSDEASSVPEVTPPQRYVTHAASLTFTCAFLGTEASQDWFYLQANKPQPLKLRPSQRSLPQTLLNSDRFQIYKRSSPTDSTPVLIGDTPIPPDRQRLFFLLIPNTKSSEASLPLKIIPLDDLPEKFPNGSRRLLNLTSIPLEVIFSSESFVIPPKEFVTTTIQKTAEGFTPIQIRDLSGNELYSNQLYGNLKARELTIFETDSDANPKPTDPPHSPLLLKIHFIVDTVPSDQNRGVP